MAAEICRKALGAHQVGLEARPQRIAAPGHAGSVETGAAQQGVVEDRAKRRASGQFAGDGATDYGKDFRRGNALLREQAIGGGPILKLGSAGGEQTRQGMASQT